MSARLTVRHAWLQKHPSPARRDGEFHWYPEAESADQRALRGRVVEQLQRLGAPATWWAVEGGHLVWATAFWASGAGYGDDRPYRGVALSVVEGAATPDELLAALCPATAAPYDGWATCEHVEPQGPAGRGRPAVAQRDDDAIALAAGALRGGVRALPQELWPQAPRCLAELWRLAPSGAALAPSGAWVPRRVATAHAPDPTAALLAAAWRAADGPAGRAPRHAWRLAGELAEATGCALDELVATAADDARPASALVAAASDAAEAAGAVLRGGSADLVGILQAWGRGWLDALADADELASAFAEELALRALATLLRGGRVAPLLAQARWHALLPASRRGALWRELTRRAPSLAAEPLGPAPGPRVSAVSSQRLLVEDPAHVA